MSNPINQAIDNSRETKSNSLALNYQQAFSNNLGSAQILSNIYSAHLENSQSAQEFYQSYVDENTKLQNILQGNSSKSLTNNRKSYYEDQGIDNLKWWHSLFFRLYIILIVAYILFLFFSSSRFGFLSKILILFALIAYIFISPKILNYCILLYRRIFAAIPQNQYLDI